MTLGEGLAELGVSSSASPDEVKRAYLRGLKTRSPERDPEGFKRLRSAYELVSARLENLDESPSPSPPPLDASDAVVVPAEAHQEHDLPPAVALTAILDRCAHALAPPPFPAGFALDILLHELQAGHFEEARRLRLAFERCLAAHGTGWLKQDAAAWKLVRELCTVAEQLTPVACVGVATALAEGDLRRSRPGMAKAADELWEHRAMAPSLASALRPPPTSPRPQSSRGRAGFAFAVMATLALFRFFSSNESTSPSVSPVSFTPSPAVALRAVPLEGAFKDIVFAAERLGTLPDHVDMRLTDAIPQITYASEQKDCAALLRMIAKDLRITEAKLARSDDVDLARAAAELSKSYHEACD